MKNLQFKGIITQSTDNTKQYNELFGYLYLAFGLIN